LIFIKTGSAKVNHRSYQTHFVDVLECPLFWLFRSE
jgi:hypothetical protein